MPHRFCGTADDFYVNMHLNTEMDLPTNRDTLLHYFEQLQKTYPTMRNFYCRDRSDYVLEEDKDDGAYRWASVEQKRICSGHVNPTSLEDVYRQHQVVLEAVPHLLSVSALDCESLNLTFCFEFNFRGNHHELLCEAFGSSPAFEGLIGEAGVGRLVAFEPSFQIALSEDCRTQARLHVEPRTNAYHIRSGEYPDQPLSVNLTVRSYGSLESGETYASRFDGLIAHVTRLIDEHVTDQILRPLQQAIAIK